MNTVELFMYYIHIFLILYFNKYSEVKFCQIGHKIRVPKRVRIPNVSILTVYVYAK